MFGVHHVMGYTVWPRELVRVHPERLTTALKIVHSVVHYYCHIVITTIVVKIHASTCSLHVGPVFVRHLSSRLLFTSLSHSPPLPSPFLALSPPPSFLHPPTQMTSIACLWFWWSLLAFLTLPSGALAIPEGSNQPPRHPGAAAVVAQPAINQHRPAQQQQQPQQHHHQRLNTAALDQDSSVFTKDCPTCPTPTCFNCITTPDDKCDNFGTCNLNNGKCNCPDGFGGENCRTPRMSL